VPCICSGCVNHGSLDYTVVIIPDSFIPYEFVAAGSLEKMRAKSCNMFDHDPVREGGGGRRLIRVKE
jgi:hypothetical protein